MKDTLISDVSKRIKNPETRAKIMGDIARRLSDLKRESDKTIRAFGKDVTQKAVADPRTMKELRAEASEMRKRIIEDEANSIYDDLGEILSNDELTRLSDQPVTARILDEGGFKSRTAATRKDVGDLYLGGEYDGTAGLPPIYFGGTESPDQLALILYNEGLITENTFEAMYEAIDREMNTVASNKENLKSARQRMKAARQKARKESQAWLDNAIAEQKRDNNPMARVRRSLVTLDAILMALPSELRGKVGGYAQLAKINSDEKRMEFLQKRIEKLDDVVEKWLRKEYDDSAKQLLKRAAARRMEPGKSDRGKHDSMLHQLFQRVEEAMKMDEAQVDGLVASIVAERDSRENAGTMTPELDVQLEQMEQLVSLFGDWRNRDASDREAAVVSGWRSFEYGFLRSTIERARQREKWEKQRAEMVAETGKLGTQLERDQAIQKEHKLGNWFTSKFHGMMDLSQALEYNFGRDSEHVDRFAEWEREASYQKVDAMFDHQTALEKFFREELADGNPVEGLKLQNRMQTEVFKTHIIRRELTLAQMIQARMMWRQEDGRRHMEGRFDEDGKQLSSWAYTQEFMDEIDSLMTEEARAVEDFLTDQYLAEWESLNAVHERVFGITMPRNGLYSPITVAPAQSKVGSVVDPLTGQSVDSMSMTPTSLIRRSQTAIAEPNFSDALHTFYAHKTQVEHWMAYAELTKELQAVLGNREVRNAVMAKTGQEGVNTINKWIEVLAKGGVQESATATGFMQGLQRGVNRASQAALVGRVSVLAIQSTQIGAAYAQMPTSAYLFRLGKLLTGQLNYKDAWSSNFIQRRMKEAPPAVRMAMEQMRSATPSKAKYLAYKMGKLIAGADAFFTAGTYAMIYDYQITKLGLSEKEAHKQAEKLTEQVAQPVRAGTRSLVENTTQSNPLTRLAWAFSSEPRQKIMLSAYRAFTGRSKAEKARALMVTWGFGGGMAAVIRAIMADMRDDDDDEIFDDKHWSISRLTAQTLAGPFQGVPVVGEGIEATIFAGFREMGLKPGYLPSGNILETPQRGGKAAMDVMSGDSFESTEKVLRDVDSIITGAAPFSDSAAAYSSFSHFARDVFNMGKNAVGD